MELSYGLYFRGDVVEVCLAVAGDVLIDVSCMTLKHCAGANETSPGAKRVPNAV